MFLKVKKYQSQVMALVDDFLKPFKILIPSKISRAFAAGSNQNRLIHIEIGHNSEPSGKGFFKVSRRIDGSPGLGKIKPVDIVHIMGHGTLDFVFTDHDIHAKWTAGLGQPPTLVNGCMKTRFNCCVRLYVRQREVAGTADGWVGDG